MLLTNKLFFSYISILLICLSCESGEKPNDNEIKTLKEACGIIRHEIKMKYYLSKADSVTINSEIHSNLGEVLFLYDRFEEKCNSCKTNTNVIRCLELERKNLYIKVNSEFSMFDIGTDLIEYDSLKSYQFPLESLKLKGALICYRLSQEVW